MNRVRTQSAMKEQVVANELNELNCKADVALVYDVTTTAVLSETEAIAHEKARMDSFRGSGR